MTTETLPAEIPELQASLRRMLFTTVLGTLATGLVWLMLQ